ncbi:hypothetical protein CY35_13G102200 [Sphagnum magellanicum]|nr:hypothetical protein CY35_13G102200 [Sphagnum magellanicum]
MQVEVEERWYNALESPLEGAEFTYEEFADALSKYDFSFEIGDTGFGGLGGTFFSFLTQAWNGHTNPKKREAYGHMQD